MSYSSHSAPYDIFHTMNPAIQDPARCLNHPGPFCAPATLPRLPRFDERNFRAPTAPAHPSSFRNDNIQLPPRKMPRFSTQSMSSEVRYYQSSNMPQGNFGPSSSHGVTVRNIEEPMVTSDQGFEIFLDVHEYKPDELKVKIVDDFLTINAEHEERMDGISLVSQQFYRRYELPPQLDRSKINCFISSDGILCIIAQMNINKMERNIPIIPINRPVEQEAKKNLKELEKKFLKSLKEDHSQIQTSQAEEESTSQQPEVVPENQEQEYVPENNEQDTVPEQNIN